MEWLRFDDLERHYGAHEVFSLVSGVLRDGEKIGLVGANGAGKSSLVRILAGLDEPDAGTVARPRDAKLGYLSQEPPVERSLTLRRLVDQAFAEIHADEARLRELEREMTHAAENHDDVREQTLLRTYGAARERFELHDGTNSEKAIAAMLSAFGFDDDDLHRPLREFSGGQRTKAMLARVLLQEPDYLILDEPTNHLDIATVRWLEDFVIADKRAYLVVSHDRYFLDRVATSIWEIERGSLTDYMPAKSAYTAYVAEKRVRHEQSLRDYESFVVEERRQRNVIAELRTHGSHNYSHVRSREKQLAKLERVDAPVVSQQQIGVRLESARRATGGVAIELRDLTKAYAEPLFANLNLQVVRGERIAILGANGTGKSTLLKIINGDVLADRGTVRFGTGLRIAYFSQNAAEQLELTQSATDAVIGSGSMPTQDAKSLLGRLGLGGDATEKPVASFSGGERRRIMLARLMGQRADCLLLDEPTNDLDIASREALESVLADYEGAMLVVSHDRYLLARLADRVLWLRDSGWQAIEGGYDAFERAERARQDPSFVRKASQATTRKEAVPASGISPLKALSNLRRDIGKVERQISDLDARKAEIELDFADPGIYSNGPRVVELRREVDAVEKLSEQAVARWEGLIARLEALEPAAPREITTQAGTVSG